MFRHHPRSTRTTTRSARPANALLVGAGKAFGSRGYADTAVEDICEAANVARSTFYRFFHSKDDVFSALLDTATTALVQAVRVAILSGRTTEEKLDKGLEAYLRAQAYAGPLARVLVYAASTPNRVGAARRAKSIQEFIELFRDGLGDDAPEDDLVYEGLLHALEAISLTLMAKGPMDENAIQRGKAAMKLLVMGMLPRR